MLSARDQQFVGVFLLVLKVNYYANLFSSLKKEHELTPLMANVNNVFLIVKYATRVQTVKHVIQAIILSQNRPQIKDAYFLVQQAHELKQTLIHAFIAVKVYHLAHYAVIH